ncbi:YhjD/YihY/BrkB family envelope integrity protein, partial [Oenococcus oeni]
MSNIIKPIINSFLTNGSNSSLSIGILVTIWSASGLIATLRRCFNQIYNSSSKQ